MIVRSAEVELVVGICEVGHRDRDIEEVRHAVAVAKGNRDFAEIPVPVAFLVELHFVLDRDQNVQCVFVHRRGQKNWSSSNFMSTWIGFAIFLQNR